MVVLKEEDESVKNKLKVWLGAYDSPIANYRYACMCTCILLIIFVQVVPGGKSGDLQTFTYILCILAQIRPPLCKINCYLEACAKALGNTIFAIL